MRFIPRPVARRYRQWMYEWENQLCSRASDRVVRPFDFGLEWARDWPVTPRVTLDKTNPVEYLIRLNEAAVVDSGDFFSYTKPSHYRLSGDWLEFASPVTSPFSENNCVRAHWFPAQKSRKAVVVLPHWNSQFPQHNTLCAGLQKLGISALRLSLPYHDSRMPAGLTRADYAVSANICRTIDAARQAVIDTRACFDWLEQRGFEDFGIVGTSLGSCYAFLASAHDSRIRVNMFNHCSTFFGDVVWEGLSSRHIRQSLETAIDLPTLRKLWLCISPPSYWNRFAAHAKRSKFIYTRFDTTFPLKLSKQVLDGARKHNWDHVARELPCGHYTMGAFPFKYLAGYEICSFLKRHL